MAQFNKTIDELDEWIEFRFDRSGGPGGQNVNKVNTRVTLFFDLDTCTVVSAEQRRLIHERLATRISRQGALRVVSQRWRSQAANRAAAEQKLIELLRAATFVHRKRRATRPSRASKERRLAEKRRRGETKRQRRRRPGADD